MTEKRRAMTPARKKRIMEAHDGKCWRCGLLFTHGEKVEYDHKQALARGGTDDDSNVGPCHIPCHRLKTTGTGGRKLGSDIFEIAKTKRLIKKQSGGKAKHKWPARSMTNLKFKKRVDGSVVLRGTK